MSYELPYSYGGMLYATPMQASKASVSDFLYASGNHSIEFVASFDIDDVTADLQELIDRGAWIVPYLDYHGKSVAEMVRECIIEALEGVYSK